MDIMERIKSTIRENGWNVEKGIGCATELFVDDGKLAITCVYIPEDREFFAVSSDEDSAGHSCKLSSICFEPFRVVGAVKAAFEDEKNFLANGGEPLRTV